MKVVILAGGLGTRLSEYTSLMPKPMVELGDYPILWHICKTYSSFGFNDFIIACGYKGNVIKDYFLNYKYLNSDCTIDLKDGVIELHKKCDENWKVSLVDTGLNTMTGGRLKRLKKYIDNKPFLLTYGDGVSDVNINKVVDTHEKYNSLVTLTAVRPNARFGELEIDNNIVTEFKEKPQMFEGWINGGFFVMSPNVLDYISGDNIMLEREPLEKIAKIGKLTAYKHNGFWQCMDSKRDKEILDNLWASGNAPWTKNW